MKKPLFLVLISLLVLSAFIVNVNAVYPYEDFLTYNEVDLGDKITVYENLIHWSGMKGTSNGVSKNISYQYWGSHCNYSFQVKIAGIGQANEVVIGAMSNGYFKDNGLGIYINHLDDKAHYRIFEYYASGPHYSDSFETPPEWDTWLYCRFFKKALNVYCEFYNSSDFTNLYQNLSHTLQADLSYDYALPLYGMASPTGWSGGDFAYLIPRADLYKVDLNIYEGEEVYGGSSKPIKIDGTYYGKETAWFFAGEYPLSFYSGQYGFKNWTGSANVTVANSTSETTTLTVVDYGTLTLYMGEWQGTIGLLWFLDRMMLWIGLVGLFICMVAPIMAFRNAREDDFNQAFLWLMLIVVLGIPLVIGWLW